MLTFIAIVAAVEHFNTAQSIEKSSSDLKALINGTGEDTVQKMLAGSSLALGKIEVGLERVDQTIESLRNIESLDAWLPKIYGSYKQLHTRAVAVIRWWDIDVVWWDSLIEHCQKRDSVRKTWDQYYSEQSKEGSTPTLFEALTQSDTGSVYNNVTKFRFIGLLPDNDDVPYYYATEKHSGHVQTVASDSVPGHSTIDLGQSEDLAPNSFGEEDHALELAKRATTYRYYLGLAWHLTVSYAATERRRDLRRNFDSEGELEGYIHHYITEGAPWTHVSGDDVYELFADTPKKDYARNLTQGMTPARRSAVAGEYRDWLATFAHRARYGEVHLASWLINSLRIYYEAEKRELDMNAYLTDNGAASQILMKALECSGLREWADVRQMQDKQAPSPENYSFIAGQAEKYCYQA
ncbi:MAG: hypothetical protein Q9226_009218, partial [Calogaya cf. arnoldii]